MNTLTAYFKTQGRFSKYPGRAAVIESLKQGNTVPLKFGRDEKCQIILINPETKETAGCIPPNPALEDNYDLLEAFVDLGIAEATAVKPCGMNRHYVVRVDVRSEESALA